MRSFRLIAVSALVVLLSGLAPLALATVSHPETYHRHARHLQAASSARHAGTRSRSRRPASVCRTRQQLPVRGSRRRGAALIAAHRHAAPIAPQKIEVATTIPTAPLKHWVILPPLTGSHQSLVRQNVRTVADGLERIEDDAQLNELRRERALVPVPVSAQLHINEGLPMNRRYCRPWTAQFLADLARAHTTRFRRSLQVNSAVRTVEYQRYLMEVNGNAAAADGDIASPHLTGAAVDIAKKGLSTSEVSWMRAYLLPLEQAGRIDVEEEFYQACFHVTVYKSYTPAPNPGMPRYRAGSTLLAERVK
ncbi:hypothetical protein HNQ77_003911 [Silvibacterium bohemicum]|uniref:Peptidase M15A C-terminal domain-containing protein n=1 Tax=Silvibacterium bohemicum TaxID=1577686 RepID=A0A841K460_9BACT|nr:DUF5715 family protein [Silvibacterium bohemicum]MBB6145941.1 hypothetical protein [Silvibacterium bohemicum]